MANVGLISDFHSRSKILYYNFDTFLALASEAATTAAFAIRFCNVSVMPVTCPKCLLLLANDWIGGIGGGGGAGVDDFLELITSLDEYLELFAFEFSDESLFVVEVVLSFLVGGARGGFGGLAALFEKIRLSGILL